MTGPSSVGRRAAYPVASTTRSVSTVNALSCGTCRQVSLIRPPAVRVPDSIATWGSRAASTDPPATVRSYSRS